MNKKSSLNQKLDTILENQKKILANEKKILGEEEKIEELEREELEKEEQQEQTEEEAIKELQKIEKDLKKNSSNPIKKITKRDFIKGFIGAFFGVMSHFAFSKAIDIAPTLTIYNTTILYLFAFAIIIVMLYYTGFRNIEKHIVAKFLPLRALVLYIVSIFTILLVYTLFGKIHIPISVLELYKLVGASIILAVLGAGTADLIGRNE